MPSSAKHGWLQLKRSFPEDRTPLNSSKTNAGFSIQTKTKSEWCVFAPHQWKIPQTRNRDIKQSTDHCWTRCKVPDSWPKWSCRWPKNKPFSSRTSKLIPKQIPVTYKGNEQLDSLLHRRAHWLLMVSPHSYRIVYTAMVVQFPSHLGIFAISTILAHSVIEIFFQCPVYFLLDVAPELLNLYNPPQPPSSGNPEGSSCQAGVPYSDDLVLHHLLESYKPL